MTRQTVNLMTLILLLIFLNNCGILPEESSTVTASTDSGSGGSGSLDTTSPTILSVSPVAGETKASSRPGEIIITFSEEIDPNTISTNEAALYDSNDNKIPGTFFYGKKILKFFPNTQLSFNENYTFRASNGYKDLSGNFMDDMYSWQFKVAPKIKSINPSTAITCAIFSDGTSKCWGQNTSSRFGKGSFSSSFNQATSTGFNSVESLNFINGKGCGVNSNKNVICAG